jgi:hypothetical protein
LHFKNSSDFNASKLFNTRDVVSEINGKMSDIYFSHILDGRPYFENEHWDGISLPAVFFKELRHNYNWTLFISGAAGTGTTWIAPNRFSWNPSCAEYEMVNGSYDDVIGSEPQGLKALVEMQGGAWKFRPPSNSPGLSLLEGISFNESEIQLLYLQKYDTAMGWILDQNPFPGMIMGINEIRPKVLGNATNIWNCRTRLFVLRMWDRILLSQLIDYNPSYWQDILSVFDLATSNNYFEEESIEYSTQDEFYLDPLYSQELFQKIDRTFGYFEGLEDDYRILEKNQSYTIYPEFTLVFKKDCNFVIHWIDDCTGTEIDETSGSAQKGVPEIIQLPNHLEHYGSWAEHGSMAFYMSITHQ